MHKIRSLMVLAIAAAASLAQAAPAPTVVTLPSGVKVTHIVAGTGAMPKASDSVTVNYRGTLLNGTEFDSSYKRNQPITFPLRGVIPCWTEAVTKIAVGGKAKVACPAKTAYGASSPSPLIPPNSDLIFEIELLAIKS